jgi:transposase InsO family protein
MKTKDEVFSWFRDFKAQVENQTGKKIKVLRSNNEGEYTSNDFKDFCNEEGIKRELTVSYNPHQNGVAKRKNQSIISYAKAMIHDQELPMFLWEEACNTEVYVQNISPHKILWEKTMKEAFSGVKPKIGHFRIFGCLVYMHVLVEKRTKMEPSRYKGIFFMYSEISKDYRIFIHTQQKKIMSRDVNF